MPSTWRIRGKDRDLSSRGMIMGVLNITPDSFSDGGKFLEEEVAVAHGLQMVAEGAAILDVGGESTRPGASPVPLEEELARVIPIISRLRAACDVFISVDTMKPEVAGRAIEAGADIVNDVSGFRNPEMLAMAQNCDAALVVMHMQGTPGTMQVSPHYESVVDEVRAFFERQIKRFGDSGIALERLAFDPGFGFGKTMEHNVRLLRCLSELRVSGRPLLAGMSRKSTIGRLLGDARMESRYWPNVALTAWMREGGVDVIRVHDVKPNVEAMRMVEAIRLGM